MLCSYLYYIIFLQLIQSLFCPSSITCVNSMDASYIPVAKARGFTTHWIITLFLMIIQIVIALKGEIPMCSNNKLVVYGAYGVVNLSILLKILVQARLGGSNPPRPDYYRLPFAIFFYIKRHQPLSQCLNLSSQLFYFLTPSSQTIPPSPALSRSTAMSSAHTANWNTLHLYHRAVPWK